MKRERTIKAPKSERPRRVIVREGSPEADEKLSKNKEQFIATARTRKDRSVHS